MHVAVQVMIAGSRPVIWAAITTMAGAAEIIRGIDRIEILERPATGLVGLKWRETRMLFGKSATADQWITNAAEHEFYKARAASDGFLFPSTLSLSEGKGGIARTGVHDSRAQSLFARVMSIPMGLRFKGVARKALLPDLNDIKTAVEVLQ